MSNLNGGQLNIDDPALENAPDNDAVIQDPKPKGYSQAFSRDKHRLTAERIVDKYYTDKGARTLWLVQNSFYHFNGSHYVEWEPHWAKLKVTEHLSNAKVPKRYTRNEADGKHAGYDLVPYDPVNEHINNVLNQLRDVCKLLPMVAPCWLPGASDGLPPADEVAPVANGLLHMKTGKLLPISAAHLFSVRSSTVKFDPAITECPNWEAYLKWLFNDDLQSLMAQEEMMAYCMVSSNKYQKAFYLSSPGRGGKGTRMEVLEALVGEGAVVGCDISDFNPQNKTDLHKAIGAAVMWFDEPTFGGSVERNHAASKIKAITGGSSISISRKYLGQWRGRLSPKIVMTGNEGSNLHDSSGVIVDRLIQIHNDSSANALPTGIVLEYFKLHLEKELPAILNRMVTAYQRLEERGNFERPASSDARDDNMMENAAPVRDFLLSDQYWEYDPSYVTPREKAYNMYVLYAEAMGRAGSGNMASFSKLVIDAGIPGIKYGLTDKKLPGTRKRVITGIRPSRAYASERRAEEANVHSIGDRKAG